LEIARALALVSELEDLISGLLSDEDHLVRAEAAGALGLCATTAARESLAAALRDRSPIVREAARKALAARGATVLAGTPAESPLDPQEAPQ
jgi:HEAT repeat protein